MFNIVDQLDFHLNISVQNYINFTVLRKTQDFSITANVIVLYLIRVMKDDILICSIYDYTYSNLCEWKVFRYTRSTDQKIFQSKSTELAY